MDDLQQTQGNLLAPRVDFVQSEFDNIIQQKGRPVLFEKALQCPCKSPSINQQSSCKNCGGSGWLFVNPIQTRMVIQRMGLSNDVKAWSEESRGTISVSCRSSEMITFMDRISLMDSEAIYNEVLFFKKSTSDPTRYFAFSIYNVKRILYMGLFLSTATSLRRLVEGEYSFENNIISIPSSILEEIDVIDFSITVKYVHPPTYHILEMTRETMESLTLTSGTERNQRLPVAAIARRTHYILDGENLLKNRIISNDYTESDTCSI